MLPDDITSTANALLVLGTVGLIGVFWSGRRNTPVTFFMGLLLGAALTVSAVHWFSRTPLDLCLAIAIYPVESPAAKLAAVAIAFAGLIISFFWSKGAGSNSFFLGTLTGAGFVVCIDIITLHWIFALHHLTNTDMDLVLEPLFVLLGLGFLWFGITRELGYQAVTKRS
jgi:hypothetical protein